MAKKIWYVGHVSAGVTLSNDHWKQRVGEDKPAVVFNTAGGFSIDASTLSARQLKWFESQPDFYFVDTDLAARPAGAVPTLVGSGGGGSTPSEPAPGGGSTPSAWAAQYGDETPRKLTETAGNLIATHQTPTVVLTPP